MGAVGRLAAPLLMLSLNFVPQHAVAASSGAVRHQCSMAFAGATLRLRLPLAAACCRRPGPKSKGRGGRELSMSVTGDVYQGPVGAPTVTLFTKADCTLCDKVKDVLRQVQEQAPHSLVQMDITDADKEEWWDRYKYDIPVLHVNQAYWIKHRLSPEDAVSGIRSAAEGSFKSPPGEPDASRLERA